MKPASVLIIFLMFVICTSGYVHAETEETEWVSLFSYVKNLGTNALKSVAEYVSEGVEKLTAKKYKDRKDICVWKICSRPLKKVNNSAKLDEKKKEGKFKIIGHMSPDGVYKYRVIKKEDDNTASK